MSQNAFPRFPHFGVTIIAFSFYLLLYVANSSVGPSSHDHTPTLFKDLIIDQSKSTWTRVYVPHEAVDNPHHKLPFIVYFHGGGFIAFGADSAVDNEFCLNMASHTQSVVVSVNYRLAPINRLPAAYDDAMDVLHLIKTTNDPWVTSHVDPSRCFLTGFSAGGNIAYNAGLRAAAEVDQIKPVQIQGLILLQPFFGGTQRTPSELRLARSLTLPLSLTDLAWNLSLPIGADRDHEYSNPTVHGGSPVLGQIGGLGWKVVVFGCDGDLLVDRQVGFVKLLKDKGVRVVGQFLKGGWHGIFVSDTSLSKNVFLHIISK